MKSIREFFGNQLQSAIERPIEKALGVGVKFCAERAIYALLDKFTASEQRIETSGVGQTDIIKTFSALINSGELRIISSVGALYGGYWIPQYDGDAGPDVWCPRVPKHGIFLVEWRGRRVVVRIINRLMLRRMRFATFGVLPDYEVNATKSTTAAGADADKLVVCTFYAAAAEAALIEDLSDRFIEVEKQYKARSIWVYTNDSSGAFTGEKTFRKSTGRMGVYSDVIIADVFDDAKTWASRADLYAEVGIPHTRGYLFYGPSGTGKTSAARDLAYSLGRSCYELSLSELTDVTLKAAIRRIVIDRASAIVLIEDIDTCAVAESRDLEVSEKRSNRGGEKLTLSALLNALNGFTECTNVIFILSSNKPEKLDEALVREGRIDKQVFFGPMDHDTVIKFIKAKCRSNPPVIPEGVRFAPIKGCKLQALLIENMDDFQKFVESIPTEQKAISE